ncbi:MAG: hypothetical protein A7316_10625 [Candidatus Altiarchaeales archaeon WOR_SM1_86-2]|nr:MAG: hypothetical protein A7316_10625 [Candidatus Altiarchaeales archaeon WOR_SM1_86-2]ODS38297.1 MAG: hypothetical protein A7315_12600 [Candidatus Altiarchaeales archaeon WOR_SM1_79]
MIEYLIYFIWIPVSVLAALDIYRDSKTRKNGFLYSLLGLFLGIPGMVVYNLVFGGNVSLAIRSKVQKGKIGPFAFLGSTFIVLGSIFFLGGLLMIIGSITGNTTGIQSVFLLLAGIFTAGLGGLFTSYDRKKRQKLDPD